MANVPIYNQPTVADKHIAKKYHKIDFDADAFGAKVYDAVNNAGNELGKIALNLEKKADEYNKTKIVDLTNKIDSYTNDALYNKEYGYFYKTGSNAMGLSPQVMADYDKYSQELLEQSGLKGEYYAMAQSAIVSKRNNIFPAINKHDAEQTKNWQNTVYTEKEANFLNQAILDRNDDVKLANTLKQGYNVIQLQAQLQDWDTETTELKKKDFASKYHQAIINGLLSDGSLRAKQYYEAHKEEISPDRHNALLNSINASEMKYNSKSLAESFMMTSASEDEALEKAYNLDNVELSDATASRIRQMYSEQRRLENQQENDLIDGFYDTVLQKQQNGQNLTFDDIPNDISSKNKLSLMSYINQNGNPKTDDDKWLELYNMSVNNAQGFANEDLNKYRGYLSDGEFKQFLKKQEEIKSGKFYTIIKDDDKMINEALKVMKLDKNSTMPWGADKRDIAYSEIRAMVREFEARKGRAITDNELMDIVNSLGYKDKSNKKSVEIYKQLEKGMNERAGFIRDVMNDFAYYQAKHNELPPNEEKMKIIQQRINQKVTEKKEEAKTTISNLKTNAQVYQQINMITPKENEQKVLTYFADSYVPQMEKELGLNLVVTSRYRNQKGSKHGEGRALDISLSEHTPDDRLKIYQKLIDSPAVYKLGCSDPMILGTFRGKDKDKIKDEREYDKKHGTNHKNHVHITLINTPQTQDTLVEKGNINLYNRPIVKNPDGTISTVRTISFNDGKNEVVIPTVSDDGKLLSNREAIELYYRTGKHFGKFKNVDDAIRFAQELHNEQEKLYINTAKNNTNTYTF